MNHLAKTLQLFMGLSLLLWSCNEDAECPSSTVPSLNITFQAQSDTVPDTVSFIMPGFPDTLYAGTAMPGNINVPLNMNDSVAQWILFQDISTDTINNMTTDTIRLTYKTALELNDLECDFTTSFELKSGVHTSYGIDSVVIEYPIINQETSRHVKIYY